MPLDSPEHELNILLTRIKDAEKGYEKAAGEADDEDLVQFFQSTYEKRKQMEQELEEMIEELEGKAEADQSFAGLARRVWVDIKEIFARDDVRVILEECLYGEQAARKDYEEAVIHGGLKPDQKRNLSNHLNEIKMTEDQLEKMIAERK